MEVAVHTGRISSAVRFGENFVELLLQLESFGGVGGSDI